jgi:hypothetical protein
MVTEEELNKWNIIIKEYKLRMIMYKRMTMRISRNLVTNVIM